ncbi:MAG: LysM peptidoglycan-binding domain-containing protein [Bacteroidota bacterium]
MRLFAAALIFCGALAAKAQAPVVPHKMQFAGMTLTIRDNARREIQKDVDALTQSPKYFGIKVERARTYFPIIEKIFAEERVPDDFKFLCLQESALIADAVSVSDAVGFWQFKDFTAREVGLRVDNEVDERMNIVSSTRGAARYIKQNNFMFNNWIYALQAYQMGAGGVKRLVGDDHDGSRHMTITAETYWYVKKFLAHKIAFEGAVSGEPQLQVSALAVNDGGSLQKIANDLAIDIDQLKEYNKWVRKETIPADKTYVVILPKGQAADDFNTLLVAQNKAPKPAENPPATMQADVADLKIVHINGVPAIQAAQGETLAKLSQRAGVEITQLMKFNEVPIDHRVVAGTYYFLDKKKARAETEFHKIRAGENLWQVSQQYGVQVKRLKKFNRLQSDQVGPGTMLWLSTGKPKEGALFEETEAVLEVEADEVMEWAEPAGANQSKPQASAGFHVVMPGETLYAIAKQYNLSVNDLMLLNGAKLADGLKAGQQIKVAVSEEVEGLVAASATDALVHEVKSSETLYSVARQYGVSINELMECNAKKDLSVAVGERLRIPKR